MSVRLTTTSGAISQAAGPNGNNTLVAAGGQLMNCPNFFSGSAQRTLAVAVKAGSESGTSYVVGFDIQSNYEAFILRVDPSFWMLFCNALNPDGGTPDTNWHVLAATYDGTTARLYLDGAQIASAAGALNTSASASFSLFSSIVDTYPGRYFTGSVGDVVFLSGIPSNLSQFLSDLAARWTGSGNAGFNPASYGVACLAWFNPNAGVTASGGNVTAWASSVVQPIAGRLPFTCPLLGA